MDIKKRQQQGYSVCTQQHTETQGGTPPLDPPKSSKPSSDSWGVAPPLAPPDTAAALVDSQGGIPPLDPPQGAKPIREHRRQGRQRRGGHQRRDQTFKFRLTREEAVILESKARAAGVKPSEYLRMRGGLSKVQGNPEVLVVIAVLAQANQLLSRLTERLCAEKTCLDLVIVLNELREWRKFLKGLQAGIGRQSC